MVWSGLSLLIDSKLLHAWLSSWLIGLEWLSDLIWFVACYDFIAWFIWVAFFRIIDWLFEELIDLFDWLLGLIVWCYCVNASNLVIDLHGFHDVVQFELIDCNIHLVGLLVDLNSLAWFGGSSALVGFDMSDWFFILNCLIDWLPAWCEMSEWFEIGCWIDCMYLRGFLGWWIRIDVAWYLHLLCFALYCWLVGLHSLNGATWLIYFSDIIENGNDRCESQRFAGWFV